MQRRIATLVLSVVLSASPVLAAELPWQVKLPFKEATIHYELKGSEQGTEILYLKDHGKLRAKHHKASATVMGQSTRTDTIELTDPDWVTIYNMADKTGNRFTNPSKLYTAEYTKLTGSEKANVEKNAKQMGAGMMGQMGGSVKPCSEKLMGYDCDVTTIGGMSSVYLLRGSDIPLRSEVSIMGMKNSVNATRIDTTSAVPASAFTPPAGIAVETDREAEAVMAQSVRQMMDTLKRPDGVESLKKQAGELFPPGVLPPGSVGDGPGLSKEEQAQMEQEMKKSLEQLKQMMPQQK